MSDEQDTPPAPEAGPEDVTSPKKKRRRISWHEGHVGDGMPVKDARPQAGRKKPRKPRPKVEKVKRVRVSQKGKKGTPGAPRFVLTAEIKKKIEQCRALNMTEEQTWIICDISSATWAAHRDRILKETRRAQPVALMKVKGSLYGQALAGSLGHIQFFAKWVGGYVETNNTQLTGKDGGPMETTSKVLTNEEIEARLRTLVDNVSGRSAATDATTTEGV